MTAAAQHRAQDALTAGVRAPPAPETVRLYAADWASFTSWCRAHEQAALPATPVTVVAYLQDAAGRLGHGALSRRVAAIANQHWHHGAPSPTRDAAVRAVLCEARRTATGRRRVVASPAQLRRMAAACPGDLAGLRDRALLLLLAAGGIGRAALVGLDAEHAHFDNTGVTLQLRDRIGEDLRSVHLARASDRHLCPARVLADWLQASETRFGPLFRKIDRWGNLEHSRLGTDAIRRILARRRGRARPLRVRSGAAPEAKPA